MYLGLTPQDHPEVGITAQEQMYVLYDVKLQCQHNVSTHSSAGEQGQVFSSHKHGGVKNKYNHLTSLSPFLSYLRCSIFSNLAEAFS